MISHVYRKNGSYYFINESQSETYGPYETYKLALEAYNEYCEWLN